MPTDRRARITVHRVYDDAVHGAGHRILVDRLWPRGITKAAADIDEWLKSAAPSTELRRWYGHDVARFDEFRRRYRAELVHPPASSAVEHLASIAAREPLILVTATRDLEHSGAEVLLRHITEVS